MNERVLNVLKENLWDIATFGDGEVNVVPVAFKNVTDDGRLVIANVFLETTVKNVLANGKIAVSAYNGKTMEGYQIKGNAVYLTEGGEVDAFKAAVEKAFNGAMTARGVISITPERFIVTTPGPDNKKEL